MLDQLLKIAEKPLKEALAGIDSKKAPQAMKVVKESVIDSLKNQVASGNLDIVQEMFSGKETKSTSPIVSALQGDISKNLISKLGIDPSTAMKMATIAIPLLMNLFNKKINDAPQANEDILSSVIDAIRGGSGGTLGNILGSILGGAKGAKGGIDLGGLMNLGKSLFGK